MDEGGGRLIMENRAARFLGIQAAEEDIEDAAKLFVIYVAGDAPAQIQICRDGIEMILEIVGVLQHARPDPFHVIVARLIAEPVRFPVDYIVVLSKPEKEIDEPSHESFHRAKMQTPQALWKFGWYLRAAVLHKNFLQLVRSQRNDRMGELHFRKPVRQRNPAERQVQL